MNFPRYTVALIALGVISLESVYFGQAPELIDWRTP
jgi:hypothetical protein